MTDEGNIKGGGSEGQAENKPDDDYKVGFGKPPKEHQFKPGNNANPRGRKKGARNRRLVIEEVLFEPIKVREGDRVKTMSKLEAIIKKMANSALTGDHKAGGMIISLAQKEGLLTPEQKEIVQGNFSETDKAILADYARRLGSPGV